MQLVANTVQLVSGGNIIKQGDETPFVFKLMDESGEVIDLQGATILVKIANFQALVLEKNATINIDNTIEFSLTSEDVTGYGTMRLEFIVIYADQTKEIFPANGWQEIKITPSLENIEVAGVARVTVETIKAEYQAQIDEFKSSVNSDLVQFSITEDNAVLATNNANDAADRANTTATNADNKATELEDRVNTAIASGTVDLEVKDARGGETTLGVRLDKINYQLSEQEQQSQTLTHGLNVINSDQASPLNVEVKGNTLVNLLGKDGNFETDSNSDGVADGWAKIGSGSTTATYVLSTTNVKYGTKAQRIIATSSDTNTSRLLLSNAVYTLKAGKHYIALCDLQTDGSTALFRLLNSSLTTALASVEKTTSGLTYVKYNPTTDQDVKISGGNYNGVGIVGWVQFDGVCLYEIDQATYDQLGVSLTDADVERMFPYVDSVQHVKNPVVTVEGDNLLPPFTEWTLHANAKVISPYELELNATANDQQSTVFYDVFPNTTYTFSGSLSFWQILEYDSNMSQIKVTLNSTVDKFTFTTLANTKRIRVATRNSSTGIFKFKNPMLNLGSTAKPFVPRNPSYLYAETTLAGNDNKKDILSYNDGNSRWEKIKNWEIDVVLDGSMYWTANETKTGFKSVYTTAISGFSDYADGVLDISGTKFVNASKSYESFIIGGNNFRLTSSRVYITVFNIDSGWTESMTPTTDMIKAYFNGWRYTGDGTTHSWVSLVGGSASSTNTLAYVSANQAPNFTPYELTYQLANSVIEPVTVEGDLSIQGDVQISVDEGVIVREKVTPYVTTDKAVINSTWTGETTSQLKYRSFKILDIYKNGDSDINHWIRNTTNAYGTERYTIPIADFDTTATYTVTYEILDKYVFTTNLNEVVTHYNKSMKSSFQSVVSKQSDIATQQSINVRAIAELYKRVNALGGV